MSIHCHDERPITDLILPDIIMVKEVETSHTFGDKPYLGFEHVTMVPHCRNLIDTSLLTPGEKEYLDRYHAEVLEKTKDFFKGDDLTMKWLERETQPIS